MVITTEGLVKSIVRMLIGGRDTNTQNSWYLINAYLWNTVTGNTETFTTKRPLSKTSQATTATANDFQTIAISTLDTSVSIGRVRHIITGAVISSNTLRQSVWEMRWNQGAGSVLDDFVWARERHNELNMTSIAPKFILNINLRRR